MRSLHLLMAASLAVSTLACTDDEEEPEPTPALTAVSYNGGLAVGFVAAAYERAPLTTEAVAGLAADFICVQEFWEDEHVEALKAATASFPHKVFTTPDPGTIDPTPACSDADAQPLFDCAIANGCDQVCTDKLAGCALLNCGDEYNATPDTCRGCITANVGRTLNEIEATCKSGTTEYSYEGAFGIGLLSSYPIKSEEVTILDSTTTRRAVIYALLDTNIGDVHAFCTHLTAAFSDIPYPKATGSWEEEQAAQIDEIIAMAEAKAAGGQVMVIGDLNTGPAGDGYIGEAEANYAKLISAGFTNPYTDTPGHPCTFCADNPIIASGNDDKESVVIDHILWKGFSGTAKGWRVLDRGITVENCDEQIDTAYSDHYGVSVGVFQ